MPRDTTPNYEPHLAYQMRPIPHPDGGAVEVKHWYVRMKTGLGEYTCLSEETIRKQSAAREMRRICEEMGRLWLEARR